MRIRTPGFAVASAVFLSQSLTADAYGQESRERAPVIRLSAALGSSVVTSYIEPSIRLSEDAYVFAISMDVDRNIQVLHPDDPGISVKMSSRKQLHLPRFFAGFYQNPRYAGGSMGSFASSSYDYYEPGLSDTRGTIIALASRKPFNLGALAIDGQWDLQAVRSLIDGRDPWSAAVTLARYLGAKGEPIGRDVHRFAGARRHYYRTAAYECHPIYGGYGFYGRGVSRFRAAALQQAGYRVQYIGIDACGQPRFAVVEGPLPCPTPGGCTPAAVGAFPRSRVPRAVPRNPARERAIAERTTGARPHTGERHPERDVTTSPSRVRNADPRRANRPRPQPVGGSFPERARNPITAPRTPVEARPAPRISEPRPVFRPAPPVTRERAPSPPPAPRAVERPRQEKPQEAKPVDG
ncbi:MAG: hypothetical protein WD802_01725 [Gemmatimonadaceae bacterium]